MKREPRILKPTHEIRLGDQIFAAIRCGDGRPAARLVATGKTVRSASFLLDCDFLMGRWRNGLGYLHGFTAVDAIPSGAEMIEVAPATGRFAKAPTD